MPMVQARITVTNPSSGEALAEVPSMGLEEVRAAIDSAHSALNRLQALPLAKRSRLLLDAAAGVRERADELALTMTDEVGRPITSSRGEIQRTAQIFELAAVEARRVFEGEFIPLEGYEFPKGNEQRIAMVKREPVGVVGAITPFNFPASSFAHKVAPALAVGCTVVHKPTVFAPLTQMKIAEILRRVGFPEGSVAVVTGDSKMIGDEFVANERVALISFTGSERVGLELAGRAVSNAKKVIMELGGSDAEIVLEDADLPRAVAAAALGRFDYAGQFCNATKRLIIRDEVAKDFTELLVKKLGTMKVGDPRDAATEIGPLISRSAVEKMEEYLNDALKDGGQVVYKGEVPAKGFYFPPVVVNSKQNERIMREEVFGPIFPVVRTGSDDEAIEIANSTPYGLDASIFTRDFSRAYRLASKLKVGTVMINDTTRLRWDNLPFGGVKRSGIGRESIRNTMLEMTESKIISYNFG
jgi:succinyl-CoA reductase